MENLLFLPLPGPVATDKSFPLHSEPLRLKTGAFTLCFPSNAGDVLFQGASGSPGSLCVPIFLLSGSVLKQSSHWK